MDSRPLLDALTSLSFQWSLPMGLLWIALLFSVSSYAVQTRKLQHIPTIGSGLPFVCLLTALRYIKHANEVLHEGFRRYHGSIFRVPSFGRWFIVVSKQGHIDELKKAPETVLSAWEANYTVLQEGYTLGHNITKNPYHMPLVRSKLSRELPSVVPEIQEEISAAFDHFIDQKTDGWQQTNGSEMAKEMVCRINNRIFVGVPLCRNEEFLKINHDIVESITAISFLLTMVPKCLFSLFAYLFITLSNVPKYKLDCLKLLTPVIEERRQLLKEKGSQDFSTQGGRYLTWLMESSSEEPTPENITSRILALNLISVHALSSTFSQVLLYLATYPQYAADLREEVLEAVRTHGWSKDAVDQMRKVDSFIKESQRLSPVGNFAMMRSALKDFTFSDGTYIPAGSFLVISLIQAHTDENIYPDAHTFKPFRFAEKMVTDEDSDVEQKRNAVVSIGPNSLSFGLGAHACTGRFFAAVALKLLLSHVVLNYDVELEKKGERPNDFWIGAMCIPNMTAKVMFRKRVKA